MFIGRQREGERETGTASGREIDGEKEREGQKASWREIKRMIERDRKK